MEEGFPNATGREQSIKGMRASEFCLHPAGDTPTSCRLFDAIASLCIPVIVSDEIELPFEGMIDYTEFSVFVSISNAMKPNWLTNYLRNISKQQKDVFRRNLAHVQPIFEYNTSYSSSRAPDGAVNYIWKKIHQKLPMIQEAVIREKRKPDGTSIQLRCHCTWTNSAVIVHELILAAGNPMGRLVRISRYSKCIPFLLFLLVVATCKYELVTYSRWMFYNHFFMTSEVVIHTGFFSCVIGECLCSAMVIHTGHCPL